jgi:hypothetical protein
MQENASTLLAAHYFGIIDQRYPACQFSWLL